MKYQHSPPARLPFQKKSIDHAAQKGHRQNLPQNLYAEYRLRPEYCNIQCRYKEHTRRHTPKDKKHIPQFLQWNAPPHNPNFSFKADTYCLEIITRSPFLMIASNRPLKAGLRLFTLARLTMQDLEARKKSVP